MSVSRPLSTSFSLKRHYCWQLGQERKGLKRDPVGFVRDSLTWDCPWKRGIGGITVTNLKRRKKLSKERQNGAKLRVLSSWAV
jgi:hypothetical protein